MRYLFVILLSVLTLHTASGRTMQDIFKDAPDSYFTTLSHSSRLDLVDFKASNMKAVVKNAYEEQTELEELTDNYLKLRLSASSALEIMLLPMEKDSMLCVVKTIYAPEAESEIELLNAKTWKPLNTSKYITIPSWEAFVTLSNGKSKEEQKLAISRIDLPFISATIDSKNKALHFSLSVTGGFTENREDVEAFFKKDIILTWNGKKFK